jgi:hypothetical protein
MGNGRWVFAEAEGGGWYWIGEDGSRAKEGLMDRGYNIRTQTAITTTTTDPKTYTLGEDKYYPRKIMRN